MIYNEVMEKTTQKTAYQEAIALLKAVASSNGFMASKEDTENYKRVWARDGVICGLAALLSEEEDLIATFRANLETLAKYQGDLGQIPSNVLLDGTQSEVSFGGLCGRIDTIPWFIIGVCNYVHFTQDIAFAHWMLPTMEKGIRLMQAWEFNNKGLMYVPRSGDWADEYILHGYVLYDQLLRLWALEAFQQFFEDEVLARQAQGLRKLIESNYHLSSLSKEVGLYHPKAMELVEDQEIKYWLPAFNPGGYQTQFDAWANAIALLLNLGADKQREQVMKYSANVMKEQTLGLLPAFWPPIDEKHREWETLQNNNKYRFRNFPYEFHNGGSWPVVNAFFGAGLVKQGHKAPAFELQMAIDHANRKSDADESWGFYENFHSQTGQPTGTKYCAWSAAGAVILDAYLNGKSLLGA